MTVGSWRDSAAASLLRARCSRTADRSRSHPEKLGDLGGLKPLPGDEHQQLAVGLGQRRKRIEQPVAGLRCGGRGRRRLANRTVSAAARRSERRRFASARRAIASSHGTGRSGTSSSRRQTTRNTSETMSSAIACDGARRTAYARTAPAWARYTCSNRARLSTCSLNVRHQPVDYESSTTPAPSRSPEPPRPALRRHVRRPQSPGRQGSTVMWSGSPK